jgi:hypothetical protein
LDRSASNAGWGFDKVGFSGAMGWGAEKGDGEKNLFH